MTDHLAVIYNHGIYGAGDSRGIVSLSGASTKYIVYSTASIRSVVEQMKF